MHWHRFAGLLLILPLACYADDQTIDRVNDTSTIGTPKKPTIEGGFVNSTEKDRLTMPSAISETIDPTHKPVDVSSRVSKNIPDEFCADKNIKQFLTTAARDHKLSFVLQRANQLKLPTTVALIPMVESHYQTDAVSAKTGAKGAWQFMPETAKEYGLTRQTSILFPVSTDAALRLLKHLHQQFHHWTLAFAAYNAGSGRVISALRRHPTAHRLEDLNLPLETKQYVDRLQAIDRAIAKLSLHTR